MSSLLTLTLNTEATGPIPAGLDETFVAPARFDTHVVEDFRVWVAARPDELELVVDFSAVAFLDLDAVDALFDIEQQLADKGGFLWMTNLSSAAQITFEMVGHFESPLSMAA